MTPIIDPVARIRQILRRALEGCTLEAWRREGERALVLELRRADRNRLGVRFLGVKASSTDTEPQPGSALKLKSVTRPGGLLTLLLPPMLRQSSHTARVRIEAGDAKLEVECEDVEWWEDGPQ